MESINIISEIGKKRTFASALDWPGWSRSGRDEESALGALLEYGPRYAQVVEATGLAFQSPEDPAEFVILERLKGDATTDFGAPGIPAKAETKPVTQQELERYKSLFLAYWRAFDRAVQMAEGKELRKGPRGGGRELVKIAQHVLGADQGYLRSLAWKPKTGETLSLDKELKGTREAILSALETAVTEGLPEKGPRGGTIWPVRYFVRRVAWHLLDHTWEIEDRIIS